MDRFSEDEARRIFAEAARTSASVETHENGLSLEELQEIGRASGLDPSAVAAAAAGVRDVSAEIPTWHGMPLAMRRSRTVPGVLTDDAWAEAVSGLRRTFKAQGVVEQIGRQRTWTHGIGVNASTLVARVTTEVVEGGTRVTVESGESNEPKAAKLTGAIYGTLSLLLAGLAATRGAVAGYAIAALPAVCALLTYAVLYWSASSRARTRPAQFEKALDVVASLAAPVSEALVADLSPAVAGPLRDAFLDLGDPPEGESEAHAEPDASNLSSRRTRA